MPRKKQIVGTKRKTLTVTTDVLAVPSKALLEIGSGSTEMFAPVSLTGDQFDALWNQLSPRGKAKVRDYADRLGLTNRGVLNRFPQFRVG